MTARIPRALTYTLIPIGPMRIRIESGMAYTMNFRNGKLPYMEKRRWYVITGNTDVGFDTWREAMDYADSLSRKQVLSS